METRVDRFYKKNDLGNLKSAMSLMNPYMEKKDFNDLIESNPRLKYLQELIKNWTTENTSNGVVQMFPLEVLLNDSCKEYFLEFADICYWHYES